MRTLFLFVLLGVIMFGNAWSQNRRLAVTIYNNDLAEHDDAKQHE